MSLDNFLLSPSDTLYEEALKECFSILIHSIQDQTSIRLSKDVPVVPKIIDEDCLSDRVDSVINTLINCELPNDEELASDSETSVSLEPDIAKNGNIPINSTIVQNSSLNTSKRKSHSTESIENDSVKDSKHISKKKKKCTRIFWDSSDDSSESKPQQERTIPPAPNPQTVNAKKTTNKNLEGHEIEKNNSNISKPVCSSEIKISVGEFRGKQNECVGKLVNNSGISIDVLPILGEKTEERNIELSQSKPEKRSASHKTPQIQSSQNLKSIAYSGDPKLATFNKPAIPIGQLPKIQKIKVDTTVSSGEGEKAKSTLTKNNTEVETSPIIKNVVFDLKTAETAKNRPEIISEPIANKSNSASVDVDNIFQKYHEFVMNAIRAADLQNDPQISNEIKESQRTKLKPFTKHFNDFDQYKSRLIPLIKEDVIQKVLEAYAEINVKGRWSQKFFSKVIKTDINDDIMTIHARFEEIHDQVCKQFQVGELTLLSVFNKTIMQPDYFVAYIKDVQKPDMKFHSIDEKKFFSTFTLETPRTNLNIKQLYVLHIHRIINTASLLKTLRFIDKISKDNPLIKFILHPETIRGLSSTAMNYTGKDKFNEEQLNVIMKLVNNNVNESENAQITVINGGPGSDKCRIIKNIVLETIKAQARKMSKNIKILLCAQNSFCIENLILQLLNGCHESNAMFKIVYLEQMDKVSVKNKRLKEVSLENQVQQLAMDKRKNFNLLTISEKQELNKQVLDNCQVVASTFHGNFNRNQQVDIVIIDGATKCTEAELMILMYHNPKKLILIGDSKQVGIVVKCKALKDAFYGVSFMERVLSLHNLSIPNSPVYSLTEQFKIHPEILKFPNETFYANSLQSHVSVLKRAPFPLNPYGVFNLQFRSQNNDNPQNSTEMNFIMDLVEKISFDIKKGKQHTIGLITSRFNDKWDLIKMSKSRKLPFIKIDTMDSPRSTKKDIIILYFVKDEERSVLERKQLNYLLTRARQSLWICAKSDVHQKFRLLHQLKLDAVKRNLFYKIHEENIDIVDDIIFNKNYY